MGQAAWGRPEMASSALVPSPPPSPTYRVVKWAFVTPIFRLFLRGRCRGMELVPLNGPLVVVANHGSHLDPPLLGHALPRPVSFMAKAELFKIPVLGPLITAMGAYPVSRGRAWPSSGGSRCEPWLATTTNGPLSGTSSIPRQRPIGGGG